MNNLSIALAAVAVWLALGFVFMGMCRAASRADRDMEEHRAANGPRSLRQHVFAIHARSLRVMRRQASAKHMHGRAAVTRMH
ncbi:hypothetical protein [Xylophilus sp. GOD-11R]|uniref:hypothetical protein n=1 Tax=Xylophilus sp. GOD-11R TaxID=3089814 RepID=UPI00298C9DBA|nr:hypothetical protein [Xylophilus sp. GOD-11R]WPB58079.1 hypothetical protein R9X41_05415 [Xylophilus sp. GOD-11R]